MGRRQQQRRAKQACQTAGDLEAAQEAHSGPDGDAVGANAQMTVYLRRYDGAAGGVYENGPLSCPEALLLSTHPTIPWSDESARALHRISHLTSTWGGDRIDGHRGPQTCTVCQY
mgnify:CR=1 FL=1